MELVIRRAGPGDTEPVARFNEALARESEGKELDPATVRRGVAAVLADPGKGFYTVAELAGEVAGQVQVTYEWSDWRNGWYWWLQSVYVRADARRRGVFRALFARLAADARAAPGVIGLRLYVEKENRRAQQTYAALGLAEEPYLVMGVYPLPGKEAAFGPGAGAGAAGGVG